MKKIFFILYVISLLYLAPCAAVSHSKGLYVVSVQFPSPINHVDPLQIFYNGQLLRPECDNTAKKVSFMLPVEKEKSVFYLLITSQKIKPVKVHKIALGVEQNTIAYLKINPKASYKYYKVSVTKKSQTVEDLSGKKKKKDLYDWRVQEKTLSASGRIPDDAITVPINASLIDRVQGGSSVEFPRIFIKDSAVKTADLEKKFHDEMAQAFLGSIDMATLHANVRQEQRGDLALKTIIAVTA